MMPAKRGAKLFCSHRCSNAYYRSYDRGYSLEDEWGTYAPETRRILIELESLNLSGTAKRLALAIDREYQIRHRRTVTRPHDIACHCLTCGEDFKRKAWSTASRDYCSPKCNPQRLQPCVAKVLTWEQVDEIRSLYASGQYSYKSLGEMYGAAKTTISGIVNNQKWKPENDPRCMGEEYLHEQRSKRAPRKTGDTNSCSKLTWGQVDEIRNLSATKQLSQYKIAEKYGVSRSAIAAIINNQHWKSEDDPRRQRD